MAEEERRKIRQRTKAALKAAKARGVKLGNQNLAVINNARRSKADKFASSLAATVEGIKQEGFRTLEAITEQLNARSIPAARGGAWSVSATWHLLRRLETLNGQEMNHGTK